MHTDTYPQAGALFIFSSRKPAVNGVLRVLETFGAHTPPSVGQPRGCRSRRFVVPSPTTFSCTDDVEQAGRPLAPARTGRPGRRYRSDQVPVQRALIIRRTFGTPERSPRVYSIK